MCKIAVVQKPFESDKCKFNIEVRVRQYAFLKDGRTVIIDEIMEAGKLYKAEILMKKNCRRLK